MGVAHEDRVCMCMLFHREGTEEDEVAHRRRFRKTGGFKKLKWKRKKDRPATAIGDVGVATTEEAEDHLSVKVRGV